VRERPYNPSIKAIGGNRVVREGVVVKYPQRGETKKKKMSKTTIHRK
jgi:hypothetical protein